MTLDEPVALHQLVYLEEGDEVTVGCAATETYAVLPPDGAALVRMLGDGLTPREAAQRYRQEYGEDVDIADLLDGLRELGFVREADAPEPGEVAPVRWQRLGTALFSRPAMAAYAALTVAALVETIRSPRLLPRTDHLFFTPYYSLIVLMLFAGQAPLMALHEAFHALAGRRLGLRSRLSVARRLTYLVLETSLDGLVTVPRRRRYLPILAGVLADLLAVDVLTLVADLTWRTGGVVAPLCLALSYATVLRIAWQGFFYLRTDVYVLLVTVLGCQDLHAASADLLRNRFRRITGRRPPVDLSRHGAADLRAARWYSWLMLVGYTFTLAMFLGVLVPTFARFAHDIWHRFSGHVSTAAQLDSFTLTALAVGEGLAVLWLAFRERRAAQGATGGLARPA
ncbi:hypothetical protein [Streptacidiphilus rugosus]|uniref:hypothetical protein n=1 Tax=Streptacidiphilus rugosus TaxID=405783 RepID=UPI000ACE835F|nr:hypothetical protein [Streptacidiphilus rugosus]